MERKVLLVSIVFINFASSAEYIPFSKYFIQIDEIYTMYTCSDFLRNQDGRSIVGCSMSCGGISSCKAMLFNKESPQSERCILVLSGGNASINVTDWKGYMYFELRNQESCGLEGTILADLEILPGCPREYNLFDNPTLGTITGAVDFPASPVGGTAYSFSNAPDSQGFLNIGTFRQSDYCFPCPDLCSDGVTFAFWLYMHVPVGQNQGFITTMRNSGPGFLVTWSGSSHKNLAFIVRRNSEIIRDNIYIKQEDFLAEYNFTTWIHFVYTYKYNNVTRTARHEAYLNGKIRPQSEKVTQNWPEWYVGNYDGRLDVGHYYVDRATRNSANMQMDELYIWEAELSCGDVIRLYQAYSYLH